MRTVYARNSLRNLHVPLFSCLVKLFYLSILLFYFLATVMVNKDGMGEFGK